MQFAADTQHYINDAIYELNEEVKHKNRQIKLLEDKIVLLQKEKMNQKRHFSNQRSTVINELQSQNVLLHQQNQKLLKKSNKLKQKMNSASEEIHHLNKLQKMMDGKQNILEKELLKFKERLTHEHTIRLELENNLLKQKSALEAATSCIQKVQKEKVRLEKENHKLQKKNLLQRQLCSPEKLNSLKQKIELLEEIERSQSLTELQLFKNQLKEEMRSSTQQILKEIKPTPLSNIVVKNCGQSFEKTQCVETKQKTEIEQNANLTKSVSCSEAHRTREVEGFCEASWQSDTEKLLSLIDGAQNTGDFGEGRGFSVGDQMNFQNPEARSIWALFLKSFKQRKVLVQELCQLKEENSAAITNLSQKIQELSLEIEQIHECEQTAQIQRSSIAIQTHLGDEVGSVIAQKSRLQEENHKVKFQLSSTKKLASALSSITTETLLSKFSLSHRLQLSTSPPKRQSQKLSPRRKLKKAFRCVWAIECLKRRAIKSKKIIAYEANSLIGEGVSENDQLMNRETNIKMLIGCEMQELSAAQRMIVKALYEAKMRKILLKRRGHSFFQQDEQLESYFSHFLKKDREVGGDSSFESSVEIMKLVSRTVEIQQMLKRKIEN